MNTINHKQSKKNVKPAQRKTTNLEDVLAKCNSKMSDTGNSLNLIERNNLLISIIREQMGNSISISTEGVVDGEIYNQHSIIRDTVSETVVAEHRMSESQHNLLALAQYLKIPPIPSIVIESVSLAQALNIFGCSGSTISAPQIITSTAHRFHEESISDEAEADQTNTCTEPQKEKATFTEVEPVLPTSSSDDDTQDTFTFSDDDAQDTFTSSDDDTQDTFTSSDDETPVPVNTQLHTESDRGSVIVPITSARKNTDTSSLEINHHVDPMFEVISESSIRKFLAIMIKLNVSEETVLSLLNIKSGSEEPVPTSISTMTKGQGYRVLNRLKQAEKNKESMVKLLNVRRAEFGGFDLVREAANSTVEKKKVVCP